MFDRDGEPRLEEPPEAGYQNGTKISEHAIEQRKPRGMDTLILREQRRRAETEPARSLVFGGSLGYNQNLQRHETEEKKPQCGVQSADRA